MNSGMNPGTTSGLASRAAALRETFDHGFASPPQPVTGAHEDFLAIRLDDAPYALRLAEITALSTDHKIAAMPGQMASLRGFAGFRGTLLPVYALGPLLGHPTVQPPRWLARTASVAFAFTRLDGHLRLSAARILPQHGTAPAQRHISGFLQLEDHIRPVLDMGQLIETVRALAGTTSKEENPA